MTEHLLKHQIQNVFSKQLRELTISGNDLEMISSEAFSTIEGGELILRIKDTRVRRLQSDIFLSLTKRLSQLTLDLRNNHINELSPSVIYGNLSWKSVGTNIVAGKWNLFCKVQRRRCKRMCTMFQEDYMCLEIRWNAIVK